MLYLILNILIKILFIINTSTLLLIAYIVVLI